MTFHPCWYRTCRVCTRLEYQDKVTRESPTTLEVQVHETHKICTRTTQLRLSNVPIPSCPVASPRPFSRRRYHPLPPSNLLPPRLAPKLTRKPWQRQLARHPRTAERPPRTRAPPPPSPPPASATPPRPWPRERARRVDIMGAKNQQLSSL